MNKKLTKNRCFLSKTAVFLKPNFNLDIFDISDITLQFSKAPYIVSL